MLPDSLNELFDMTGSDEFPSPGTNDDELAGLTHALIRQSTILRLVGSRFARDNDMNHVDFYVLMSVMTASDQDITVTPGYISEHLSLSASTLTSILNGCQTVASLCVTAMPQISVASSCTTRRTPPASRSNFTVAWVAHSNLWLRLTATS